MLCYKTLMKRVINKPPGYARICQLRWQGKLVCLRCVIDNGSGHIGTNDILCWTRMPN